MPEFRYFIYPHRGLITSVSPYADVLKELVGDGPNAAHIRTASPDMMNVSVQEKPGTCRKADGYQQYTTAANATATRCLGLYELTGEINGTTDHIMVDAGKVYVLDGGLEQDDITGAGVTLASDQGDIYSFITYGNDLVLADHGEHVPYHWENGDAAIAACNTTYKARLLEYYKNRILAAYTDQSSGQRDLRWADANVVITTNPLFPEGNQLFSGGRGTISGLKRWSRFCPLYHQHSVMGVDFYEGAETTACFGITDVVSDAGPISPYSVVDALGAHYFFTRDMGFCRFAGGTQLEPISEEIRNLIDTVHRTYANQVVGTFDRVNKRIIWTVPLYGSTTMSHLLIYYPLTQTWEILDYVAYYVDYWQIYTSAKWSDFDGIVANYGDRYLSEYTSANSKVVFANTNGHIYNLGGNDKAGSALDGYRVEPVLDNGDATRMDTILEIIFHCSLGGDFNLNLQYKVGDTPEECWNASWSTAITQNMAPSGQSYIVFKPLFSGRCWTMRYGTDGANEKFGIDKIEIVGQTGSRR